MFLLTRKTVFKLVSQKFSSPIFGDMFLLFKVTSISPDSTIVFVSYIRRYVLTYVCNYDRWFNCGCVFVSYIRRYVLTYHFSYCFIGSFIFVFVSYIRRYVLTKLVNLMNENFNGFRLLYSEICSYY